MPEHATIHLGNELAVITHLGSIRDRVDRGVAALSEVEPDWQSKIDPTRLNLRSPHHCVCGQVFDEGEFAVDSGWSIACRKLDLWGVVSTDAGLVYRAHWLGLAAPWPVDATRDWNELRAEWLRRLS